MKCVALSRIVYGEDDWCYGKSLIMLAKAYHEHGGENCIPLAVFVMVMLIIKLLEKVLGCSTQGKF